MEISESLHQILQREDLLADLFYEVFLNDYPELQRYFRGVDMKRQALLLTMALVVIANHYSNRYPATEMYLKYLGSHHHQRNIPPEAYPKFAQAMLDTLSRFHGNGWTDELQSNWLAAIDLAAQTMRAGYGSNLVV